MWVSLYDFDYLKMPRKNLRTYVGTCLPKIHMYMIPNDYRAPIAETQDQVLQEDAHKYVCTYVCTEKSSPFCIALE
jgi:hypothetical protein